MTTPADHNPGHAAGEQDGIDLTRLGEITDRDGFAVFDPAAPHGVRALTPVEKHALADSLRSSRPEAEPVQGAVAAEFDATPEEIYTPSGQVRPGPDHRAISGRSADHWYAQALDDADTDGTEPEETQAWEQHQSHLAGATAAHTVYTDAGPLDMRWVANADTDALDERSRELEQRWLHDPQAREDDLLLAEWDVVDDEIERRETADQTPPAHLTEGSGTPSGPASPYRLDADWGDPDYREPHSDEEAAARTAYVREHFPASGWTSRANTELEDAVDDAAERAVLSDRAHDHDPYAWAEYERLLALDRLASLPPEPDALDSGPDQDERVLRDYLRDEAAVRSGDTAARETADDRSEIAPNGSSLPAANSANVEVDRWSRLGAAVRGHDADVESEQRREQLARWHEDDHASTRDGNDTRSDKADEGADGAGWDR